MGQFKNIDLESQIPNKTAMETLKELAKKLPHDEAIVLWNTLGNIVHEGYAKKDLAKMLNKADSLEEFKGMLKTSQYVYGDATEIWLDFMVGKNNEL